jgi:hypothetical protein
MPREFMGGHGGPIVGNIKQRLGIRLEALTTRILGFHSPQIVFAQMLPAPGLSEAMGSQNACDRAIGWWQLA